MTETERFERWKKLKEVASPLMEFLQKECHPHMSAIVTSAGIELVEGVCYAKNEKEEEEVMIGDVPIGETFEHNGIKYMPVMLDRIRCYKCDLFDEWCSQWACNPSSRNDKLHVIFKKIEENEPRSTTENP